MNSKEIMQQINYSMGYLEDAYDIFAKSKGLNYNSLIVICILCDMEKATQKQICDIMHLPKTTVHSILHDFMSKGLISLAVNPENRKEKFVVVTSCGKEYFAKIVSEVDQIEARVFAEIGEEKCLQLKELTQLVAALLNREAKRYVSEKNGETQNE